MHFRINIFQIPILKSIDNNTYVYNILIMDIQTLVQQLFDSGLSGPEIESILKDRGISCTQATINRYKTGDIKAKAFQIYTALVELHSERVDAGLIDSS